MFITLVSGQLGEDGVLLGPYKNKMGSYKLKGSAPISEVHSTLK